MKKLVYLMLLSICMISIQSCEKDDEIDTEWKDANEAAFNQIAANPAYSPISIPSGPGVVYRSIDTQGTGTVKPIYTAKVTIQYKGTYYDGSVFDYGTSVTGVPTEMTIGLASDGSKLVDGFQIALQNMVVGDKWKVWIPWNLGYGATGQSSIPGYSTLVFDIELVSINQYP